MGVLLLLSTSGIATAATARSGRAIVPPSRSPMTLALPTLLARPAEMRIHAAHRATFRVRRNGTKQYVYGCAASGNYCNVYTAKSGTLLNVVSTNLDGPEGTMADRDGNWYVANTNAGNIVAFTPGGGSIFATLDDPNAYPGDVAVHKSLVAASNLSANSSGPGNVAVYVGGATTPSYTLSAPSAFTGIGIGFDGHGDCFWSYNTTLSGAGRIVSFRKCSRKSRPVDLGLSLGFAGGLAFDGDNNLWYLDQFSGLYRCAGVTACTLVESGFADPSTINFSKSASALYLMDSGFGIYKITDLAASHPRIKPDYIVTPFASIPSSDSPVGVGAGPGH